MSSVREWGDCEHGIRIHKCPECALSELTTLRARIAELEREKGEWARDKARLDWLLVHAYSIHIVANNNGTPYLLVLNIAQGRAAIDAAMKPTT